MWPGHPHLIQIEVNCLTERGDTLVLVAGSVVGGIGCV